MKQDMIVILDLGSHENTVVARAIRALGVYSEIYPHDITASELKALPNVKGILGIEDVSVSNNQQVTAAYMNSNDFDIVAVQEDFGYHRHLAESLSGFTHSTNHTGGIPGGDGLNIFTKGKAVYNETRVAWNEASGILSDGSDALTPKGFVYSVIDVGNGIYVDFYNLHADAYGGEGSIAARTSHIPEIMYEPDIFCSACL